jgi:glycerophosphoryl diester phosphodiesterase
MLRLRYTLTAVTLLSTLAANAMAQKIVIAHRGASGYLPEHTLEAKAMAYAMGADYIEQDVVMTKDDRLIVLHDITLDRTTDVDEKFPSRARGDGRYYAIDFTLAEIKTLNATESFGIQDGNKVQSYSGRFPIMTSAFQVPTLEEEIELIQGLNKSTGKNIGIYPEIKSPEFHRAEGKDLSSAVVAVLKDYGYINKQAKVFLQTFSFDELKIIHDEILPAAGINLNLVMLLGNTEDYPWIFDTDGMQRLAQYADGLGPSHSMVVAADSSAGDIKVTDLVSKAHAAGMQVHPYTYRKDPGQIPPYAENFNQLLDIHFYQADVDGVFTDFTDLAVEFLRSK